MNRQGEPAPDRDLPAAEDPARPHAPRRAVTEELDGPAPGDDVWSTEPVLHDA